VKTTRKNPTADTEAKKLMGELRSNAQQLNLLVFSDL
jgi:hypothetical protein